MKLPMVRTEPKLFNKSFGVFDVETAGLGGPLLDSVAQEELGEPDRLMNAHDLFIRLLDVPKGKNRLMKNYTWYAHNLGGYDALYLIDEMLEFVEETGRPIDTICQGQKIIGYIISIDRGDGKLVKITLMDSLPLIQVSLAQASKVYAPEYQKHGTCPDHNFVEDENVFYEPSCPVCYSYLLGDCDALMATLRAVELQEHQIFGINLKITGGSAGVELLKRTLDKNDAHYRQAKDKEDFLYQAVYGGYVWPGQDTMKHDDVVTRDCTAAYAARARQGVPCGTGAWVGELMPELPGIYHVTASCPESTFFPLVPNKDRAMANHSIPLWPTGEWDTWIPSNVIEFATQHGYKFDIHEGIVFSGIAHPYDNMMDMLERMECPNDGHSVSSALKFGCKIKRNSVIGKSATKPIQESIKLGPAPMGTMPLIDEHGMVLPFYIVQQEVSNGLHIQPHWNSWITAAQRITVQTILIAAGTAARYADTDSVAIDREVMNQLVASGIIPTSEHKQYGSWPVESEWDWFQAGGPKNYLGQQKDGPKRSKAKGIRAPRKKQGKQWDAYLKAHEDTINGTARPTIEFDSVRGARDIMKHPGGSLGIRRQRRFSTIAGSMTWQVDEDRKVRPYHLPAM
jgi:hypothetical protein